MAWLIEIILNWALKVATAFGFDKIREAKAKEERNKKQDAAFVEYQAVLANPASTDEQVARAYEKYIVAGRTRMH